MRRFLSRVTSLHVLLLVAVLEVAINRVIVPMTRPPTPILWQTSLDYFGLFLFYFTGTLAALVIGARVAVSFWGKSLPERIATVALGVAALLAAIPIVVTTSGEISQPLEIAFGIAVIVHVVTTFSMRRDLGVQIGLVIIAIPLLLHTASALGAEYLWPEQMFDGPSLDLVRYGVVSLCIAALATPYCFAPRPFSRAVTRPGPVIFAMLVAALGAATARLAYPQVAEVAWHAIGVELNKIQADQKLALYLLATATLVWTLASCTIATTPARQRIGMGLAFVVLGGYAFRWPAHYLLPLLGLSLISEAARTVRDEELEATPLANETPPISDSAWAGYLAAVTQGLRDSLGHDRGGDFHSLTTRGEGGLMSSVIVGGANGGAVRVRIERIDGCVLALDVMLGKEFDEVIGATFTVWAIPDRALGASPPSPPAAPSFKSGDAPFDERFRLRGNSVAFGKLMDEALRARALATLDGWLAYWEPHGLRYRVYPGRGAPLDHPMPLSDLALHRPVAPDRLISVIELLVEISARGVVPAPAADEPEELLS